MISTFLSQSHVFIGRRYVMPLTYILTLACFFCAMAASCQGCGWRFAACNNTTRATGDVTQARVEQWSRMTWSLKVLSEFHENNGLEASNRNLVLITYIHPPDKSVAMCCSSSLSCLTSCPSSFDTSRMLSWYRGFVLDGWEAYSWREPRLQTSWVWINLDVRTITL